MDNKYNVDDILNEIKRKKSAKQAGDPHDMPVYPKPSHTASRASDEEYMPKREAHPTETADREEVQAESRSAAAQEQVSVRKPTEERVKQPEPERVDSYIPESARMAQKSRAAVPTYTDEYRDEPMANRRIQIDDTLQDFFRPKELEPKEAKRLRKSADQRAARPGVFSVAEDLEEDDSIPVTVPSAKEEDVKVYSAHTQENGQRLATNYEELKRQRSHKVNSFSLENSESGVDSDFTQIRKSVHTPEPAAERPADPVPPVLPVSETPSTVRARESYEESLRRAAEKNGDITEYTSQDQIESILRDFSRQKSSLIMRLIFTAVVFVVLIILSLNAAGAIALPEAVAFNDGGNALFYVLNVLVLCAAVLICHVPVGGGLLSLFKLKANSDTLISVSLIASLMHAVSMIVLAERITVSAANMYFWLPILALAMNTVGKLFMLKRIAANFAYVSAQGKKNALNLVEDADLRKRLTGIYKDTTGKIVGAARVHHLSDFLDISYDDDFADNIHRTAAPIAIAASLLVAVIVGLLNKDVFLGFTVFAAMMAIAAPFTSTLAAALPIGSVCADLLGKGAMLSGYAAAEEVAETNVVLMDATELFKADDIELHAIKTFSRGRVDEALLDAASVICQVKNTLNFIFDKVISGNTAMLKKFDNLIYEDGMGLSAWVNSKRVLIGNRMLMEHHGIETPDLEYENRYTRLGQNVIYLSNSGELTAMFILSYKPSAEMKETFSLLKRRGVTLAVNSTDPNITAKLLSDLFQYPADKINIVSSKYQDDFELICDEKDQLPAKAATDGTLLSEAYVLNTATSVKNKVSAAVMMQLVGMVIGCALVTFFSFIGGISSMSAVFVLIYQICWTVIISLLGTLRLK